MKTTETTSRRSALALLEEFDAAGPRVARNSNGDFDPAALRKIVERGQQKGLLKIPGVATPVQKAGHEATAIEGLRSQWMKVTPEMARQWLENNFRNRPLRYETVQAYARDMKAGMWTRTHQGIAFNDRDELMDGQHRLHAVVKSGCTIEMMVTFGLPSVIEGSAMTPMDAVDRGATRSVADQLKLQHNMKDGSIIAAVCAVLGMICYGAKTKRLSVGQTLEIYEPFRSAVDWVILHRSKQHGLRAAGVLAAFAFAQMVNGEAASMFKQLVNGTAPESSAIGLLRTFLTSDEAILLSRGTDRGLSELVLHAIWLELEGRRVERLELAPDGAEYFRGRQPERVAKVAALFALPE